MRRPWRCPDCLTSLACREQVTSMSIPLVDEYPVHSNSGSTGIPAVKELFDEKRSDQFHRTVLQAGNQWARNNLFGPPPAALRSRTCRHRSVDHGFLSYLP